MKYYSQELYHYGLKGMKWGTRRWQYDDGRFNDAGKLRYFGQTSSHRPPSVKELQGDSRRSEKKIDSVSSGKLISEESKESIDKTDGRISAKGKAGSDSVLKKFSNRKVNGSESLNTEGSTNLKELLGISDAEAEKLKKYAKVAGISLATAAGITAAGYIIAKQPQLLNGYNRDILEQKALPLGKKLFENKHNLSYVGTLAKENGYGATTASQIRDAIANPKVRKIDYGELIQNVRRNQIKIGEGDQVLIDKSAWRRLSCWSASQSYWLSALTGGDYVSKSFENLADFNDFGKLYKKAPKIYNAFGQRSLLFVGKFGEKHAAATEKTAKALVENIFKRVNSANNLTPDGSRTIGFINAAYHHETCTHEFNFELLHNLNGSKSLVIADGYTGKRFFVGNLLSTGKIDYDGAGMKTLIEELGHYNANSLRFYAPSLKSVDPEMLSKVILGKL